MEKIRNMAKAGSNSGKTWKVEGAKEMKGKKKKEQGTRLNHL